MQIAQTPAALDRVFAIGDTLRNGDYIRAEEHLAKRPEPDELVALEALANIFQNEGKTAEAAFLYRRLSDLCPLNPDVLYNLGNTLRLLGRFDAAAEAFGKTVELDANDADARQQFGNTLCRLGRSAEAEGHYRYAIALKPGSWELHVDLGNALRSQGQLPQAIEHYRKALEINARYPLAHYNLGVGLMECGQFHEAIECYRSALAASPDLVEAKWNCALCLLTTGNFEQGWELFESRLEKAPAAARKFPMPRWSGGDLGGKDILIHAEQGFGDTLQFARYVTLLSRFCRPRAIVLECQPELTRLLQNLPGVSRVIAGGVEATPVADVHFPLLSLPLLFRTGLDTIPARTPYIKADDVLVHEWKYRLRNEPRMKVGLAWSGRATHPDDARRSLSPAALSPLFNIAHVCFVSLQPGASPPPGLLDHAGELRDFADTAALISRLDLVISVDTAVAHLAGAMGKRVWLLSSWQGEWRWLRDRSDSPWYPSMTIFRQSQPGCWDDVMHRAAAELQRLTAV